VVSTPTHEDGSIDRAVLSRRLLIAAALSVGVAGFAYLLMVRTSLGQRFDNAALIVSFQQSESARINDGFFVAKASATVFFLALLTAVGVGVVRHRPRIGWTLAVTAVVSVLVTHALKVNVLTRPMLAASDQVVSAYNTYPSGHTATAVAAAMILVVVSPPAARGLVAVLAGAYASVIAQDVQTAGWHRPSDAIGAAFVVFAIVAVVAAVLARRRPVGRAAPRTNAIAYPVLAVAGLTSGLFSAINAARALNTLRKTSDTAAVTPSLRNDAHYFSISLTVLVVASLLAVLLALLGSADLDEPADPN
jgi:membrane-associated phospholipid phosphatase